MDQQRSEQRKQEYLDRLSAGMVLLCDTIAQEISAQELVLLGEALLAFVYLMPDARAAVQQVMGAFPAPALLVLLERLDDELEEHVNAVSGRTALPDGQRYFQRGRVLECTDDSRALVQARLDLEFAVLAANMVFICREGEDPGYYAPAEMPALLGPDEDPALREALADAAFAVQERLFGLGELKAPWAQEPESWIEAEEQGRTAAFRLAAFFAHVADHGQELATGEALATLIATRLVRMVEA